MNEATLHKRRTRTLNRHDSFPGLTGPSMSKASLLITYTNLMKQGKDERNTYITSTFYREESSKLRQKLKYLMSFVSTSLITQPTHSKQTQ
jgi:hypothetical protein